MILIHDAGVHSAFTGSFTRGTGEGALNRVMQKVVLVVNDQVESSSSTSRTLPNPT